ncbi:MAG: PilZ domain-containing protein [Polyangiales bacterium]
MTGQEQRKHRRFGVEVAAEVTIDGDVLIASTQNLSSGGAALVLEREVSDGASLEVTLFLTQDGIEDPEEEPFEATAQVMWGAPRDDDYYAVGVQFRDIDGDQQALLGRFLAAVAE